MVVNDLSQSFPRCGAAAAHRVGGIHANSQRGGAASKGGGRNSRKTAQNAQKTEVPFLRLLRLFAAIKIVATREELNELSGATPDMSPFQNSVSMSKPSRERARS